MMNQSDQREANVGNLTLRLRRTTNGFGGVVIEGKQIKERIDGVVADDVWRQLHDAAARLNPLFIGYSSARARFLHFFSGGFSGPAYERGERAYKLVAKEALESLAPLEVVHTGLGFGEGVIGAFRKTNLLASFEQMRIQDLLRSPHADEFVRLCAAFAVGDTRHALPALRKLLKPYECAKWTVITYLPFLWNPDEHFFLKPNMVRTFAERVGHRFANAYRPDLEPEVYEALIDLAQEVRLELADMGPRDMIDVQSFMWTVVEYKEGDRTAPT